MLLQPDKKSGITQQPILDHFRQPGLQFTAWQGTQNIYIGQHTLRLIKRTDHVFAQRVIDACFTAY